jgi:hypothetical protein
MASGNGAPCDAADIQDIAQAGPLAPVALVEPDIFAFSQAFDRDLTAAQVPHTADFYGCGIHSYRYFQRDLHAFWPRMINAFGMPPPASFNYRTADARFGVWGWSFAADPGRAAEFLDVADASGAGLTLTGSGAESITTGPLWEPHEAVAVSGGAPGSVRADSDGRIAVTVDLGPPHDEQQYTLAQGLNPEPFVTRTVRFDPPGHPRPGTGTRSTAAKPGPGRTCRRHRHHGQHRRGQRANPARRRHNRHRSRACRTTRRRHTRPHLQRTR